MNKTAAAAASFAQRFTSLGDDEVQALQSEDGVEINGCAVWHRQDDDMIVAYTNPDFPEEDEQWAEVPVIR